MGVSTRIYDPTTQLSNYINVNLEVSLIQEDEDADFDFYIRLSTDAKRGPTGGEDIPAGVSRSLAVPELALVTRQFKVDTSDPYASLTDSIEDFIDMMVEGVNPGEHMYFGT